MSRKLGLFAVLVTAAALGLAPAAAFATHLTPGSPYFVQLVNAPTNAGPAPIAWSPGSYTLIPGSEVNLGPGIDIGLEVDEVYIDTGPNSAYLELAFQTEDADPGPGVVRPSIQALISTGGNAAAPSGIFGANILRADGGPYLAAPDPNFFVWFTVDGVPQDMSNPLNLEDVVIIPHPLFGHDVLVVGVGNLPTNPDGTWAGALGVDTGALDTTFAGVMAATGLGSQIGTINDVHFGVLVTPEPGSIVMAAMGLVALVGTVVYRRRK